ncbi:MAG: hypothetical protein M0C28_22035 [Candidatus Moduliflexus flocculans]|nr:hypothetical protein [Candidatus Moduliflexus flocculans]
MAKAPPPRRSHLQASFSSTPLPKSTRMLRKAFAGKGNILFRWDAVEDVDLPVLQLLYAARKEAARTGREFHFLGLIKDRVASRLAASGFVVGSPPSGEELEADLVDF